MAVCSILQEKLFAEVLYLWGWLLMIQEPWRCYSQMRMKRRDNLDYDFTLEYGLQARKLLTVTKLWPISWIWTELEHDVTLEYDPQARKFLTVTKLWPISWIWMELKHLCYTRDLQARKFLTVTKLWPICWIWTELKHLLSDSSLERQLVTHSKLANTQRQLNTTTVRYTDNGRSKHTWTGCMRYRAHS